MGRLRNDESHGNPFRDRATTGMYSHPDFPRRLQPGPENILAPPSPPRRFIRHGDQRPHPPRATRQRGHGWQPSCGHHLRAGTCRPVHRHQQDHGQHRASHGAYSHNSRPTQRHPPPSLAYPLSNNKDLHELSKCRPPVQHVDHHGKITPQKTDQNYPYQRIIRLITMKDYAFEIEMKVRDYECDLQGVVNNSNYQHYMEHARHEFLETTGTSFSALHDQGIDVMVSRIDISYKHSLRGSDRFVVQVAYQREGIKLVFFEDIYKLPENILCAKGRIEAICLQNGKLTRGELFETIFINKVEKKQE